MYMCVCVPEEEEVVYGRDRTLGVVVGVLQRERREYVASFEVRTYRHVCTLYTACMLLIEPA